MTGHCAFSKAARAGSRSRWATLLAVAGMVATFPGGLGARQLPPPGGGVEGAHEDHVHAGAGSPLSPDTSGHAFTLNVYVSETGFEPSTVFVPSRQRVQLVLRNLGVDEHHYRVVGLATQDLLWMAEPPAGDPMSDDADQDHQMHHAREFVTWRGASPSGITPTGSEVHAYVSAARGVDVMLFTPTTTGTFIVECDLHSGERGKMEVFEGGWSASRAGAGLTPKSLSQDPLGLALSRDLGTVESPGTTGVFMEATYAPAEYLPQLAGGPVDEMSLAPEEYVAILLTEGVHTGRLPGRGASPALYVDGDPLPLIDSKVTTELPHHRVTLYRFARDEAFGTSSQVMTLRLAPGHEASWELSSPSTSLWLAVFAVLVGLVGFGWWIAREANILQG